MFKCIIVNWPLSGHKLLWTAPQAEGQLYELVTHEEGPSGRLGGEHQALWSEGPSWEAVQVGKDQDR